MTKLSSRTAEIRVSAELSHACDVDYNDDEYEDIGKVRKRRLDKKMMKTRNDEEAETEDDSEDEENG